MDAAVSGQHRQHSGLMDPPDAAEDPRPEGPHQLKSRSGPEFLGLSRCAGCYNRHKHSMPRHGSGSSADDSDSHADSNCDSDSSSSSDSFTQEEADPVHEKEDPPPDERRAADV